MIMSSLTDITHQYNSDLLWVSYTVISGLIRCCSVTGHSETESKKMLPCTSHGTSCSSCNNTERMLLVKMTASINLLLKPIPPKPVFAAAFFESYRKKYSKYLRPLDCLQLSSAHLDAQAEFDLNMLRICEIPGTRQDWSMITSRLTGQSQGSWSTVVHK